MNRGRSHGEKLLTSMFPGEQTAISSTARTQLARDGAAHSGLDPPIANAPQTCLPANSVEVSRVIDVSSGQMKLNVTEPLAMSSTC